MGIFKRKKKVKLASSDDDKVLVSNANKKQISRNIFKIYLREPTGGTTAQYASFECKRWFEEDSEIPYLRNDKLGFLEVVPELEQSLVNLDEKNIDTQISKCQKDLKDIGNMTDNEDIMKKYGNPKNIRFRLMKLEAQKRSLKYKNCSFMEFGENGEKEFTFKRVGSHFLPRAYDEDTNTSFYPSDAKKKSFAFTHRNKQLKHGMGKKIMTVALAATWIFGLFFLMGTGYLMFQAWDKYTAAEVIQAREEVLQTSVSMLKNLKTQSDMLNEQANALGDRLQCKSVTVEGLVP